MSDLFEVVLEGPGKNALGTALMESILSRLDSAKDAPLLFASAGDGVATDDTRALIGLNEVALGLVFPPKIARIVHARVPPRSIHEVVLRGALHNPAGALRTGLVDELASNPRSVARSRLEELAHLPRHAFTSAKRFLRDGVTAIDEAEYTRALDVILPSWTSDEVKQRALAHLQRR